VHVVANKVHICLVEKRVLPLIHFSLPHHFTVLYLFLVFLGVRVERHSSLRSGGRRVMVDSAYIVALAQFVQIIFDKLFELLRGAFLGAPSALVQFEVHIEYSLDAKRTLIVAANQNPTAFYFFCWLYNCVHGIDDKWIEIELFVFVFLFDEDMLNSISVHERHEVADRSDQRLRVERIRVQLVLARAPRSSRLPDCSQRAVVLLHVYLLYVGEELAQFGGEIFLL
jgi:hypothetical protein